MYSQYATIFDSSAASAREVDRKSRFIGWLVVCLVIPTVLFAQPAAKKTIVGVWEVKLAPVGQSQSPLLSLAMYGSDGTFTTCGGYKALAPIPVVQEVATEASPGYGRWAATGDRELRLTFYVIMWKEGLANGYQRVQEMLVLSEPGDDYTGHAQVDFLDANWNVVFSTTSDVKGTRLETPAMLIAQQAEKKQLVGVWEVKVSPVGQSQSPLLSLAMYGADGNFTTVGGYKGFPPVPAVQDVANELGPGYGRWAATSDREFRLTFYSVMWKAGLVNGYQRVQDTLVLSESGDEYTGHAQVDFLDANWNVVFSTTIDVMGTRLETPIPAMLLGQAAEKNQLAGVWAVKNMPNPMVGIVPGIDLISADGSFISTNNRKSRQIGGRSTGAADRQPQILASIGTVTPGLGRCVATGTKEFRLMFYAVEVNKEGVAWGFLRVQNIFTLSEAGDEFTGRAGQVELLDANWTVVFRGTSDVKTTRLETPDED
jgi:hypothetical protein